MNRSIEILLQDTGVDGSRWLRFRHPHAVLAAREIGEVLPLLAEVERSIEDGWWTAGFLSYEAGPAFDPTIVAHLPGPLPLAWWGIFRAPQEAAPPATDRNRCELAWRPGIRPSVYRAAVADIRDRIAAGDTYQVNYTFPLEARFEGEPKALFAALCRAQRAGYCAYLDTGRFAICSASPELFFRLEGDRITTRPMKGTARRGRHPREDELRSARLRASPKDRAENVMIVDMMRNDLGKVARPGSVRTEDLFTVETYPTVHQLTSTVRARTDAPVSEILGALFPCASITGAPKVSTAGIIRRLEAGPRGVYTGAIGFLAPPATSCARRAQLNVAIRTATVDRERGHARYGTGGGIVWDSDPEDEYQECRAKALVLSTPAPSFRLLETLLWRPLEGYFLLERHLQHLGGSARYFGFAIDLEEVRRRLASAVDSFAGFRHRVRLLVDRAGRIEIEGTPWPGSDSGGWSFRLADRPIDSSDPFLFHKTTHRRLYDEARRRCSDCDEVVLWNERGELTEATRANLVLEIGGEWLTPELGCGLLAGTYREDLLARGRVQEAVLPVAALAAATRIFLVNSVRGWIHGRAAPGRAAPGRAASPWIPASETPVGSSATAPEIR